MALGVQFTVYGGYKGFDSALRKHSFLGQTTITGTGTYATNGIPFTWALLDYAGNNFTASRATIPDQGTMYTIAGSTNTYLWDQTHNTLRILVAGVELANSAAIPAGVTADVIEFYATFRKVDYT